ncbi:MAG: V-type ATP synthase subunit E [Ruminococcus sp.]|nr:V-type ATP synthase subunit E [Ruminococcus sp.]
MAGIDKIIQQIESDTKAVCDDIILKARTKSDKILTEAKAKAEKITADGRSKTAARIADIEKRGESSASLEERKVALYTKQSIISDMLKKGLEAAKALPDNEYFELILKMIEKNSQEMDGVISFGQKDLDRLPAGFIDRINSVSGGKLTLSDKAAAIDAGFILSYGGIEENCSFDSIFMSEADNLSDRAGKLLF